MNYQIVRYLQNRGFPTWRRSYAFFSLKERPGEGGLRERQELIHFIWWMNHLGTKWGCLYVIIIEKMYLVRRMSDNNQVFLNASHVDHHYCFDCSATPVSDTWHGQDFSYFTCHLWAALTHHWWTFTLRARLYLNTRSLSTQPHLVLVDTDGGKKNSSGMGPVVEENLRNLLS